MILNDIACLSPDEKYNISKFYLRRIGFKNYFERKALKNNLSLGTTDKIKANNSCMFD